MRAVISGYRESLPGEWIIVAPDRRYRANAYAGAAGAITSENCPFCPGHESETPPEIERRGNSFGWRIRVVPNKYPAVASGHEVIVETAEHLVRFDELEADHAREIVDVYKSRYAAHRHAALTMLFKNEGVFGGASVPHPHSQLIALERLTPRFRREIEAVGAHCWICTEANDQMLTVARTEHFAAVAPSASKYAWQVAIAPIEHTANFLDANSDELARLMQIVAGGLRHTAQVTDYNWNFMNAPDGSPFHWYLDITPRLTVPGGFEIGAGSSINIVPPEETAAVLRRWHEEPR